MAKVRPATTNSDKNGSRDALQNDKNESARASGHVFLRQNQAALSELYVFLHVSDLRTDIQIFPDKQIASKSNTAV